jgi:hypothetical protein
VKIMGREIKRVPLDFEWPIGKIWEGYLNPFYKDFCDCPFCGGNGYSEDARNLQDRWYGNADFKPEDRGSMSFKPDNPYIVTEAECKRLGFETRCEYCKGEGRIWPNAETKQKYETWEPTEPPPGEGYQMWETTSEGFPMSPVFKTPEVLARWLAEVKASLFGHQAATYEEWLSMIKGSGWAPSAACIDERGLISGVSAMVTKGVKE